MARREAYHAVLSEEEFLTKKLDPEKRAAFFETGRRDIENFLRMIHRHVDPDFVPHQVLELGCGVGRLLLPLAEMAEELTGIDVAPSMLEETEKNLREAGIDHFELLLPQQLQDYAGPPFDFIFSYIVFQHIQPRQGMLIMAQLLRLLKEGGVGVFHVPIKGGLGRLGRFLQRCRAGHLLLNLIQRRPLSTPVFEMYRYPMNDVLRMIADAGVRSLHLEMTDHGGEVGALIVFQKGELAEPKELL